MADEDLGSGGGEGEEITLPAVWVGVEETDVTFVNTFLLQLDGDMNGVLLTAGSLTPPAVVGSHEEQQRQVRQLSYVAVKPAARLGMTRKRFEELRALMNQVSETWAKGQGQGGTNQHD